MEADELAGLLRGIADWAISGSDGQYPELDGGEVSTGNEDTGFFLELSGGERFLVTVAKVA